MKHIIPEPLRFSTQKNFDTTESANGKIKVWYGKTNCHSEFITTTSFNVGKYQSFIEAVQRLPYMSIIDIKTVEEFSSMRIKLKERLAKGQFYEDLAELISIHVDV